MILFNTYGLGVRINVVAPKVTRTDLPVFVFYRYILEVRYYFTDAGWGDGCGGGLRSGAEDVVCEYFFLRAGLHCGASEKSEVGDPVRHDVVLAQAKNHTRGAQVVKGVEELRTGVYVKSS